jgi:hypothetical protein
MIKASHISTFVANNTTKAVKVAQWMLCSIQMNPSPKSSCNTRKSCTFFRKVKRTNLRVWFNNRLSRWLINSYIRQKNWVSLSVSKPSQIKRRIIICHPLTAWELQPIGRLSISRRRWTIAVVMIKCFWKISWKKQKKLTNHIPTNLLWIFL